MIINVYANNEKDCYHLETKLAEIYICTVLNRKLTLPKFPKQKPSNEANESKEVNELEQTLCNEQVLLCLHGEVVARVEYLPRE